MKFLLQRHRHSGRSVSVGTVGDISKSRHSGFTAAKVATIAADDARQNVTTPSLHHGCNM
ncbi:hypothetical protein HAX54_008313, partial [Datura stramonium]|nr:hypothetical protein [Datura stramonium]